MNKRYIPIILSILIGIGGAFAYPAYGADCTARPVCTPVGDAGNSTGGGNHPCACFLWHSQLANHACRLTHLLQTTQRQFLTPTFKHIQLSGLSMSINCWDRLPTLNRTGPTHLWDPTGPPLSVPIYLQNLSLLC